MVTYQWYTKSYGGRLEEATFSRLAARAALTADAVTGGRLRTRWDSLPDGIRDVVSAAICACVEQLAVEESGGPVASESNDGISRTYASPGGASTAEARLAASMRLYLAPTGLLYRGCGR